jgi:hypothetical protein
VHRPLEEAQRLDAKGADLVVATHSTGELSAEENRLTRGEVPLVQLQSKGRSLLRVDLALAGDGPFEQARSQTEVDRELGALDQRLALLDRQVNEPSLPEDAKRLRQAKRGELVQRREALARTQAQLPTDRNAFSLRFVPLESTLPSDPTVQRLVEAYDRDVGKLNLEWAKAHGEDCRKPEGTEPSFAGNGACVDCHEESFGVWKASKHAHAYDTLEQLGKQYHLDCVGCHVTGHERPGGVCRVDKVAGREDVGCESCHGPGSKHVADPSADNVRKGNDPAVCMSCHNVENSPHFDFARYLPRVLGPGHGAPGADKKAR